jgi:hypothetical protein
LELDETLTQAEVEYRFGTNFGYQFKGITYRSPDTGRYVILLANEGTVYDDSLGRGRTFTYVGEGVPEKGDQIETVANRALLDAVDAPRPPRCGQCGTVSCECVTLSKKAQLHPTATAERERSVRSSPARSRPRRAHGTTQTDRRRVGA